MRNSGRFDRQRPDAFLNRQTTYVFFYEIKKHLTCDVKCYPGVCFGRKIILISFFLFACTIPLLSLLQISDYEISISLIIRNS